MSEKPTYEELKKRVQELEQAESERERTAQALRESEARFRLLYERAPLGYQSLDERGCFIQINQAWLDTLGYTREEVIGKSFGDFLHPDWAEHFKENFPRFKAVGEVLGVEFEMMKKDGTTILVSFNGKIGRDAAGNFQQTHCILHDITERKKAEESLRRIEWMLTKSIPCDGVAQPLHTEYTPLYGDLLQLNTCRVILNAVGKTLLSDIARDYLDLLETSSAIYEKNGDYALGIFSSGWCRFMDNASRRLCKTEDNGEALRCGRWLCHESCWQKASKTAIETGAPVDIECEGGLRLYTLPIRAGEEIVGSINFGYGDPPRDLGKLHALAEKFSVSVEDLAEHARSYESRPLYIMELAKSRLKVSAQLIGEIVNRKQTENALRESEAQLHLALEAASAGSWEWDLGTGKNTWSKQLWKMYGLKPYTCEASYKVWRESIIPEDRERVDQAVRKAAKDGVEINIEWRVRDLDNTERWLMSRGRPFRNTDGVVTRYIGIVIDITERKQAESYIIEQRNLAGQYLQIAGVMICALNSAGEITLINEKGLNILGYDDEQALLGKNWFDIILPKNEVLVVKGIFKQIMSGDIKPLEYYENPVLTKAGQERRIAFHNSFLQDKDGAIKGILFSGEDITERKRAEEERARLNADLEAKNTELEQMIYVASHDLRSPLVNIDGYSKELDYAIQDLHRALQDSPGGDNPSSAIAPLLKHDIPEALRYIRTSASKMDTLLTGLLRLSRLGRAALKIEPLDMNRLIGKVIDSTGFKIKEAGVKLEVGDLPSCRSDAVQVSRIFSNILDNGLKYLVSHRPGVIRITGRIEEKRSVYCVEDNGTGIASAYLDTIFELFNRLDPARVDGDGLGLTIVKRIAGRLEGTVWAESDVGSGSRFYVALPAEQTKNK